MSEGIALSATKGTVSSISFHESHCSLDQFGCDVQVGVLRVVETTVVGDQNEKDIDFR